MFKKKNPYINAAQAVYARALLQARLPVFYTDYGVPDTQPARFDLLLALIFPVISRMKDEGTGGRDFNQALFDVMFADMDQSLREIGIGDTGIPKRMKAMMKAFNGRMHAYDAAADNDAAMTDALRRNLYADAAGVGDEQILKMKNYISSLLKGARALTFADIAEGRMIFPAP